MMEPCFTAAKKEKNHMFEANEPVEERRKYLPTELDLAEYPRTICRKFHG